MFQHGEMKFSSTFSYAIQSQSNGLFLSIGSYKVQSWPADFVVVVMSVLFLCTSNGTLMIIRYTRTYTDTSYTHTVYSILCAVKFFFIRPFAYNGLAAKSTVSPTTRNTIRDMCEKRKPYCVVDSNSSKLEVVEKLCDQTTKVNVCLSLCNSHTHSNTHSLSLSLSFNKIPFGVDALCLM